MTGAAADGDEMMVDSVEKLPEELVAKVDETHQTYVVAWGAFKVSKLTLRADYPKVARSALFPRAGLPQTISPPLKTRPHILFQFPRLLRSVSEVPAPLLEV